MRNPKSITEMAEGIERMTEGNVDFEKATWLALAFQQSEDGTYDLDEWVFVESLGYRIPKSELYRLSN